MSIDERARHELYRSLEEVLGAEAATTLMEHLPPGGWVDVATGRDLRLLEERLDAKFGTIAQRFEDRLELTEQRVLAAFRGELVATVTGQTRTLMFAILGIVFTGISLAFMAARFA
jgi:hypothetical protein